MPDRKKVLLLANGTSGTNSAVNDLFEMIRLLSKENCIVTVYPIIPHQGLVCENVLTSLNDTYDVIACCGGDGTLNHVVSQVLKNNINAPIGYIPTGSTNDFSRSINNGKALSLEEQCDAIANGIPFAYDVGRINEEYFNYIAAFGAFTRVSYDTSQKWKNTLGYAAYTLNAIAIIPEGLAYHTHVKFEHDGISDEGDYIFGAVANTNSIAGVQSPLVQNAELDDGQFEVILIKQPNNLIDINRILSKLTSGNTDDNYVTVFKTDHIKFSFDSETAWTLDGEKGTPNTSADIQCLNKAVSILIARDSNQGSQSVQ